MLKFFLLLLVVLTVCTNYDNSLIPEEGFDGGIGWYERCQSWSDLNGDGLADVYCHWDFGNGDAGASVWINNGCGWVSGASWNGSYCFGKYNLLVAHLISNIISF